MVGERERTDCARWVLSLFSFWLQENYRGKTSKGQIEQIKTCRNVELVPGKDSVTATDIKMLHSMDDAEVYNNIKNCKPAVQEWEKPAFEDWKDKHPNEELPKRWNISINEIVGEDENVSREEYIDESTEEVPESDMITRLHEIIDSLSELQKETYRKVIIEEMSNTSVAAEENKSEAAVRKIINRIKQIIAEDDELKKYFQ